METAQLTHLENMAYRVVQSGLVPGPLIRLATQRRTARVMRSLTPRILVFYVTNRCPLRCQSCFYWRSLTTKEDEVQLPEIRQIARTLAEPLTMLSLTGGEPFVRDDLPEICEAFYTLNKTKRVNIVTSGFDQAKVVETVKRILAFKKTLTLMVSIDGFESTHTSIRRRKDSFQNALTTVRDLQALHNPHLQVFVGSVLTSTNYHEMKAFHEYISSLGVTHKVNILRDNHSYWGIPEEFQQNLDPMKEQPPTLEQLKDFHRHLASKAKTLSEKTECVKMQLSLEMMEHKRKTVTCLGGYGEGVIYPNGDVATCEPTKPFANLKTTGYDIRKLWASNAAIYAKKSMRQCFCLQPCNLLHAMKHDPQVVSSILNWTEAHP